MTKALEWAKQNPWFGKDFNKTMLALDIHQEIVASGVQADSDEYYELLDRKLRVAMYTKAGRRKQILAKKNLARMISLLK
jgi:hypothetical protein